ncbi:MULTISPECIES: hypothetical protein [Psychrobacter]|uniref:Uncharacterized protein n=1 Tax=Psychrobacter alimentarius TaxID=261164 RepID=A0ABN4N096_9GAMM|nr:MULTISPECIES: hypothetical protein [Psychrobacter]AMT95729.1 hypothetical protein A3K91_0092 [Psychrobacter alimentarius]
MNNASNELDEQEQEIQELAADINPSEETTPDSLAEATTAPLADNELGDNATNDKAKK